MLKDTHKILENIAKSVVYLCFSNSPKVAAAVSQNWPLNISYKLCWILNTHCSKTGRLSFPKLWQSKYKTHMVFSQKRKPWVTIMYLSRDSSGFSSELFYINNIFLGLLWKLTSVTSLCLLLASLSCEAEGKNNICQRERFPTQAFYNQANYNKITGLAGLASWERSVLKKYLAAMIFIACQQEISGQITSMSSWLVDPSEAIP